MFMALFLFGSIGAYSEMKQGDIGTGWLVGDIGTGWSPMSNVNSDIMNT